MNGEGGEEVRTESVAAAGGGCGAGGSAARCPRSRQQTAVAAAISSPVEALMLGVKG
jgi:hypothetical protein